MRIRSIPLCLGAGKFADVIALANDPRADLHEMGKVIFVMKGGRTVRDDFNSGPFPTVPR